MFSRTSLSRVFFLSAILLTIGFLHKALPLHQTPGIMLLVQKLFFLPVILASFWFGLRGGIGTSLFALLLYPHSMEMSAEETLFDAGEKADMVLLVLVGCVTGLLRDSALKRQDALEKASAERDEAYRKLQKSIERIKEQEGLAVLGRFSAVIAHEVRNPLYGMLGAVEILEKKIHKKDKSYFCIETLTKEIERLTRLTGQFLDYAKPAVSGEKQEVSLYPFLEEKLRFFQQGEVAKNDEPSVSYRLEGDATKPYIIKGDPDALSQLFLNLLANAKEAVMNVQEKREGMITLRIIDKGEHIEVQVEDNGCGMTEEEQLHLFKPFFTTRNMGSGLGLMVVSRILREHHASVEVKSRLHEGSCFHLFFSRLRGGEAAGEESKSAP